jgi:hypothetical protein
MERGLMGGKSSPLVLRDLGMVTSLSFWRKINLADFSGDAAPALFGSWFDPFRKF